MNLLRSGYLLISLLTALILLAITAERSFGDVESVKVMVMVEEKIAGLFQTTAFEDLGQTESIIVEKLVTAGFTVVDPRTVKTNIARDQALRILEGDNFAAASAGLQYGAQVVITGKAFSKQAGGGIQGSRMQSVQGMVQLRAVHSDDGRIISSRSAQTAAAHIDEAQGGVRAVRGAAGQATEALIQDILAAVAGQDNGQAVPTLTVVITNLVSYRHLTAVRHYFETELAGVHGLDQRSYTMGTAELGLKYDGSSTDIAEELAYRRFPGFRLEPTNVTANRVDLRAVLD
jgi:hypothetical protein